MDISIVLKRGLVYSIIIAAITTFYLITVIILEKTFQTFIGYQSLITSILYATIIAIFFTPVRNKIQYWVDRHFFKGSQAEIADENEQLRKEVAQAEKSKAVATLASGIAHEIRNPLTSLQTFFEYFPQKKNDPEFMQKFNDIAGKEINRINDLIKQLLEFAKPSPLELQDVNITQIIDSSLALLENQIKKSKVQIIREFNMPPDVTIKADPNKLKQAFINLILNAIEAMTGGGELTVLTSVNTNLAPHLMISITDTGCGIKKEDLHHIFDPFFSKKEKGTGLGLAITEGIIKEHQGQIKVRSTVAVGTTFIIELPINRKIICST